MKTLTNVAIAVTLLACSPAFGHGRLADLAVYDRTEGRWLQVYRHEGRAYVVGKPGHEYRVRVANRLGEDVLAVVSVDGVNVITGQTAHPSQSGYVVSPRGSVEIDGWRKDLSQTAAFYFTALPDSYAARTGRPDDVGVIGVALFRRKPEPPRISEAPSPGAGARATERADSSMGTGHGRREHSPAMHVTFERATSAPAEVFTLYYDSHANLVARGVIRDPVHVAPRPPRPFPGFVPDPRG